MMSVLGQTWIFIPLFGLCIFILTYILSDRILFFLKSKSLGQREYVIERLDAMFVPIDRQKITISMLLVSFGIGFLIFLIFWPKLFPAILFSIVFIVLGWSIPRWTVDYLYNKRLQTFVNQLVDALTIMGNGIQSGLSVPQSMERIVENMQAPVSQEFSLILSQVRLGLSLEDALNQLATRLPSPDIQMLVLSINILKETGGNLAETFSTIVETIRERQKIERKIEALTAQGIMQGVILTLVPFGLLLVFLVIDPNYVKPLFNTTLGLVMLTGMLFLQFLGGLTIRKIVKIRV